MWEYRDHYEERYGNKKISVDRERVLSWWQKQLFQQLKTPEGFQEFWKTMKTNIAWKRSFFQRTIQYGEETIPGYVLIHFFATKILELSIKEAATERTHVSNLLLRVLSGEIQNLDAFKESFIHQTYKQHVRISVFVPKRGEFKEWMFEAVDEEIATEKQELDW